MVFLISCTSKEPTAPPSGQIPDYFPNSDGTNYLFTITETDSTGILRTGSRYVYYDGDSLINGTSYLFQKDSIRMSTEIEERISNFRKSETGVFYFVDTSGFAAALPDTLRNRMTITSEMQTLLLLLAEGSFWQVFKVTIELQPEITFAPYRITANHVKEEDVLLHLISGDLNVTAQKIKYDLEFRLNPEEPAQKFTAFSWVAVKIGIIKIEGNSIVVNAILNGEVNLADSSKTVTQNLIEYSIP
ncbi:MAG: hypothetical protein HKM87_07615 [Ignavibacteriaceae bacterium]|nr:hypothetical protein [Ignavibacteriaceae bacterium]